jgi:hypothetical protein
MASSPVISRYLTVPDLPNALLHVPDSWLADPIAHPLLCPKTRKLALQYDELCRLTTSSASRRLPIPMGFAQRVCHGPATRLSGSFKPDTTMGGGCQSGGHVRQATDRLMIRWIQKCSR